MSNKPKSFSTLAFKILLTGIVLILNFGQIAQTMATEPAPANPVPSGSGDLSRDEYSSFNVSEYLTIKGQENGIKGTQDQKYLKTDKGANPNPTASFILQAINLVALTAASLSFLAIVAAGFLMMTSAGNETQRTKGIDILTRAIIGLVITLSAYFIVSFVQNLLFETVGK
jgi:hypothetical protein